MTDKYTKAFIHYVAFREDRGVWLGEGRWSKLNPGDAKDAPTFPSQTGPAEAAAAAVLDFGEAVAGFEMKEVHPRTPPKDPGTPIRVTKEDIANALLPVW